MYESNKDGYYLYRVMNLITFLITPLSIISLVYIGCSHFRVYLTFVTFVDTEGILVLYLFVLLPLLAIDIIFASLFKFNMLLFPIIRRKAKTDNRCYGLYNNEEIIVMACDLKQEEIIAVGKINKNYTFSIDNVVFEEGKVITLHKIEEEDLDCDNLKELLSNRKTLEGENNDI